tara:strand:+ start:1650 stop:1844 length:195 start_codon:yes stop_codon:yes gene_type:complete
MDIKTQLQTQHKVITEQIDDSAAMIGKLSQALEHERQKHQQLIGALSLANNLLAEPDPKLPLKK